MKTIEELYPSFIQYLKIRNKITTIDLVNSKFKIYILPYFGKYKPNEITEKIYIDFQISLLDLNRSESFYVQVQAIMNNLFDYLKLSFNIENIPKKIGFIKNQQEYSSSQKKDVWTGKEFNKFIRKVDDKIYHALFNMLFYTGIRKGEALALKISDFDGKYISISHTITKNRFDGKRLLLTPKSKASIGKIKLHLF